MDLRLQFDFAGLAARSGDCTRALPVAEKLWRQTEPSMMNFRELVFALAHCRQTSLVREVLIVGLSRGLDPGFIRSEPAFRILFAADELERILSESGGPPPSP